MVLSSIYRGMQALILLPLFTSCIHLNMDAPKPIDYNVPELSFSYLKNTFYKDGFGQASDFFSPGDKKVVRVKSPDKTGEAVLITGSGSQHIVKAINNDGWVEFDLGQYTAADGATIEFGVTTPNTGTQFGRLYPVVGRELKNDDDMKVALECPVSTDFNGSATCLRPAGFDITFTVSIRGSLSGKVRAAARGCEGDWESIREFTNGGPIVFTKYIDKPQYCRFRIDMKAKDEAGTEFLRSKEINVTFYNKNYRFLPQPEFKKEADKIEVCGLREYRFYEINGVIKHNDSWIFGRNCEHISASEVEFSGWDSSGRFVHVKSTGE